MRTCQNRSPVQMWVMGLHTRSCSHPNDPAVNGLHTSSDYGIDWDGPISILHDQETVIVPEFIPELRSPIVLESLQEQLNHLSDNKIIHYLVAKDIISNLVSP